MSGTAEAPLLEVEDLNVSFRLRAGTLRAVRGLSYGLERGRVLCIVGESGSGKSVSALSLLRLIDRPGRIDGGRVLFRGTDLLRLSERELEDVRGNRISMIFQDPMNSLNPAFTIGEQIAETLVLHRGLSGSAARQRAIDLLELVGIPDPAGRYDGYPHQFSGGMRQRVMIASAIACEPELLIADEPTTALDVTIQAQILQLLGRLQRQLGSAMIFITHDLGVVASIADDVLVMYAGRAVEYGPAEAVLNRPQHPYTQGLLESVIELDDPRGAPLRFIPGAPKVPLDPPPGCGFRDRCRHALPRCAMEDPPTVPSGIGRRVACHLVEPLAERSP